MRRKQTYAEMADEFKVLMLRELQANDWKGGPGGWTDVHSLILDTFYHVAKLQEAVRGGDELTRHVDEFCADVANLGMIVWFAWHHTSNHRKITFDHDGQKIGDWQRAGKSDTGAATPPLTTTGELF